MNVLDLGCGPGTITADIAGLVAPGRVLAVDIDAGILHQARTHAQNMRVTNIDFKAMDAYALDCPDASFDFSHAHQVLQHVCDPVAVLRELIRVTRPGGKVAVRDGDYDSFTWYPAHPGLDRWLELYCLVARGNGGEPDAGRHLLSWAHQAGLTDVAATSSTWTYSGDGARWWAELWAERCLHSAITEQFLDHTTQAEVDSLSRAWLEWCEDPDAWIMIPSAEILATVH